MTASTTYTLPDAELFGGDWFTIAKPLVDHGWYCSAAAECRYALERAVRDKLDEVDGWHRVPKNPIWYQLPRGLKRAGVIDEQLMSSLTLLRRDLSDVIHDRCINEKEVKSAVAKALIARTAEALEALACD